MQPYDYMGSGTPRLRSVPRTPSAAYARAAHQLLPVEHSAGATVVGVYGRITELTRAASLARTSGARRGCLRVGSPVYSCGERVADALRVGCGACAGGKALGLIVQVAARAVVRDAKQQVPSVGGVKPREGVLPRPSQSIWSGVRRVYNSRLCLRARQACGVSASCCGIPCAFFMVVSPVASESFCWVHVAGWLVGDELAS